MYKSVTKTVYKISDFLSWQRSGSLVLSPSFQRRSVWPLAAKSLLVDTVVRGIPVPIIFIREQTDLKSLEPIREVVDGQQRLRTLISFVDKGLIANYDSARDSFTVRKEHNSSIAGKSYSDLEATDRKAILTYEFSVHVLPSDTDDRQILQIFARMNSTGVRLNNQELRNAMYFGVFKSLAYKLAYEQLGRWRAWGVFTEDNIARMDEVETTSELMRLMLVGQQSLSQPGLNKLYGDNDERFNDEKEVAKRFRHVMDEIDRTYGQDIRKSSFARKALFDTLFTFYYDVAFGLGSSLSRAKPTPISPSVVEAVRRASEHISKGVLDESLARVLRGGTGNKESRQLRLKFVSGKV